MIKTSKTNKSLNTFISESSIPPSNLHQLNNINSYNKFSSSVSKSSSEGISLLDGSDTAITSLEDNKNLLLSNNNNMSTINNLINNNSIELNSGKLESDNIIPNSLKTMTPDLETLSIPISSVNNSQRNNSISSSTQNYRINPSIRRLSKDENNFKVTVPPEESIHMRDDSSTQTTSSEDYENEGNTIGEGFDSYQIMPEISSHNGGASRELSSNIDPLTPILNQAETLPLPDAHPGRINPPVKSISSTQIKSNTFPRTSVELKRHSFANFSSKNYPSISTIKIPDNYQRTELAITSGAEHHRHRKSNNLHPDNLKRHRSVKGASFMNNTRMKAKMRADDLYNIPGQNISENHENYAIVYDLVTGIRSSVSRCSKAPTKITDDKFLQVIKLIFNRQGNTQAPPTKYEFKFKDYAPEVFRDLRNIFKINQADYLMSLSDEIGVRAVGSSGKSGSSFYYSNDRKFIIKTIHRSEHKHLRRILKDYYNYVKNNPNTLLCQFYGLHRLKMVTKTGTVKVHVLVMNNLLPPTVNISDSYDLKGSTYGRKTSEKKQINGSCMKDLNFIENKTKIHLSKSKKGEMEKLLKSDVDLLKRLNIMDYSLLLGIQYLNKSDRNEILDSIESHKQQVTLNNSRNSIFDTDGGIRAIDIDGQEMDVVYYVGIIDCLTNYNTMKKLETFFRSLKHKRETISAVPPYEYGDRFLRFILSNIETPGSEQITRQKGLGKLKASILKFAPHHHTA